MPTNDQSILLTVKKTLGLAEDYTVFDDEIVLHINSVMGTLSQLGIGPELGFEITGQDEQWSDLIGQELRFSAVKSYVYYRVKLMFDPPDNPAIVNSIEAQILQAEWRINVAREDRDNPYQEPDLVENGDDILLDGGVP